MPARAAARIASSSGIVARGRVGEVAEDREVDVRVEVAEGQHLEVLEQLAAPRPRWSSSVGTTTMRPRVLGDAGREVEARQPPRRRQPRGQALDERDGQLAGRAAAASSATADLHPGRARPAARA